MLSLFMTLLTTFTHAASPVHNLNSGLECTMEYSSSGALSSYKLSTGGWLSVGDELAGTAMITDGDSVGIAGTSPANYIKIAATKVDGDVFWSVQVLGGEKNTIGVMNFPDDESSGMKSVFPVNALADESEDPAQFDTLEVICVNTIFAG